MKKTKRICNRICAILLSVLMGFMGIIPSMPVMTVYASEITWDVVGDTVTNEDLKKLTWDVVSSVIGVPLNISSNKKYYNTPTETVTNNNKTSYYYRGGNTTTTNTTSNYKVFNDYTNNSSTTTNYKYSFYNPVTNNYNYTNEYRYNQTYNTYNYTTYNATNNYTTNYYIQDNSTHINYYIVEEDTSTGEIFETYYEIYFELPDGRNSYDLKREDIWGTYFIYDYSKYESVAEDDGTTLGLWHLDGNTKDSSYWGNSAGSSYTLEFKDAKHDGGKYLSNSLDDYLELSLDEVSLPDSYTLEWIQYVSDNDYQQFDTNVFPHVSGKFKTTSAYKVESHNHISGSNGTHDKCEGIAKRYLDSIFAKNSGIYVSDNNSSFDIPRSSFVCCAMVYSNGTYSFFRNGVKVFETSSIADSGLQISNDKIRFCRSRKLIDETLYEEKYISTFTLFHGYTSFKLDSYYYTANTSSNGPRELVLDDYFKNQADICTSYMYTQLATYNSARYKLYECTCNKYYYDINCDTIIDEVRLSKGALYTGNYTPSSQPFTTNTVLAVPENPSENEVAFKTNYNIGNVRFGGARPTYPATGDIFVAMTGQKVDSIQQYQETGWYEVQASIYNDGEWKNLKNFDMSVTTVTDPENPDPDNPDNPDPDKPDPDNPDKPDPDNPDNPDQNNPDNPGDKESIWDKLGKVISGLMGIISKLLSPLIDGIISLIGMIVNALESLSGLSNTFGSFLKDTFVFIPEDIMSIIGLGVMLTIFASIIKIFM